MEGWDLLFLGAISLSHMWRSMVFGIVEEGQGLSCSLMKFRILYLEGRKPYIFLSDLERVVFL